MLASITSANQKSQNKGLAFYFHSTKTVLHTTTTTQKKDNSKQSLVIAEIAKNKPNQLQIAISQLTIIAFFLFSMRFCKAASLSSKYYILKLWNLHFSSKKGDSSTTQQQIICGLHLHDLWDAEKDKKHGTMAQSNQPDQLTLPMC